MSKMEQKDDIDQADEMMLPGFRFHPTDEELVGFYLRRKVQQRPLSIELIKQLDIYKYDPWDLPKMASIGEKEWYFYCPRDRKYRNSARPNRVTSAGFWKATGTDRPIYSSDGTKCIGLKKSLVFYKGRAAKGIKTDWMMHEFRLPTAADSKGSLDKNLPPNDAWAICRIFKKNTISQRALSHAWAPPLAERRVESISSPMNSDMVSGNCMGAVNFIHDPEEQSNETRNQTSTSSNLSNSQSSDHQGYNRDFQPKNVEISMEASYATGLDGSDKVESSKSMSSFCGLKSMGLPNLELPNNYYSHVDPLSLKGTLDLVSCMLQMSPMAEFSVRPSSSDITAAFSDPKTNYQNFSFFQPEATTDHHEDIFLKHNITNGHHLSPRSASSNNLLQFPPQLYDVLKSNVSWD